MKLAISTVADAAFVVGAMLLGIVALRHAWLPRPNAAVASPIAVGTAAPPLPGIAYSNAGLTVIVAVSTRCRFCTDSMPFYRRLQAEVRAGDRRAQFVAMAVEDVDIIRQYLERHVVTPDAVVSGRDAGFDLRGTPTLILVDHSGRVVDSLQGLLTDDQQSGVVDLVRRLK